MWNLGKSKSFLLTRSSGADRVGQQATQRTASTEGQDAGVDNLPPC